MNDKGPIALVDKLERRLKRQHNLKVKEEREMAKKAHERRQKRLRGE